MYRPLECPTSLRPAPFLKSGRKGRIGPDSAAHPEIAAKREVPVQNGATSSSSHPLDHTLQRSRLPKPRPASKVTDFTLYPKSAPLPMVPRMLQALNPIEQLRAGQLGRRLLQLFLGLSLFGISNTLLIRSNLGLDPWNVFHQGLMQLVPLSLGQVIIAVGLVVLLFWIPLRQWPGLGTIANVTWVGVATDFALSVTPSLDQSPLWMRAGAFGLSIVICAAAVALYIGTQLGPGPRDGLMTGIAARSGRSIRFVRTLLELFALSTGWLMGGDVGVGTVAFALCVGPLVQVFLPYAIVKVEQEGAADS